ncbi:MAG: cation diffusion facilitator family transporter [Phenylobacterium sp.]|uniref:cation diffusion facilitator family transporter n=1 Tax=Phenylobacterium sp. TaxID=1871053 RepID=UPI002726FEE7|nr:cation diffusion facilitator family transporter [Phenylobacterium sp.]MDO8900606.1 cation diffusion facilitator family transporter [Phenylobacterium sp.]
MAHDHPDHPDGHGHAQGHSHDHSHGLGGHHHHAPKDFGRAFAIGAVLNTGFVIAEVAAGLWFGSLALLADAGHNLSDVMSLLLAWGAVGLAKRKPAGRRTYGLRKATILASLVNAILLLVAVGAIVSEALRRIAEPSEVAAAPVMIVAAIGVVINTVTALMFIGGAKGDLNIRGAFLHMAADAAVSLAVVVGAGLIALTSLYWLDPALSLLIVAVILVGTWGLLRDSVDLALDAAPRGIDVEAVRTWLGDQPGVAGVHDLHIWALSTTETALTAHITRPDNTESDAFLHAACEGLQARFGIGHATLQVETGEASVCRLFPAEVV